MSNEKDRFTPPSQIACRMEVHPSSVGRIFARDGGPAPIKVGCRTKFLSAEVDAYLKKRGIA
jgi:hypothetical protein